MAVCYRYACIVLSFKGVWLGAVKTISMHYEGTAIATFRDNNTKIVAHTSFGDAYHSWIAQGLLKVIYNDNI